MALIVGGQTVTTDEAGTNKLDATKLFGNLPALDGTNLTNVGLAAANFTWGEQLVNSNTDRNVTAPNPGVAFGVGGPTQAFKAGANGQTINLRNTANGSQHYSRWVTIAG
jgi:hypothetical protein